MSVRIDQVSELLREVAALEIVPRFRELNEGDIEEKSKGDFVTIADRRAELWLTPRLEKIVAGSRVLGEEATAASPKLLSIVESDGPYWTVDPIDGTSNFIAGRETFGVMVSLVETGLVRQAWIYLPMTDALAVAEEGAGAFWYYAGKVEAERITAGYGPKDIDKLRGAFNVRFMDEVWRDKIERFADMVPHKSGYLCSAWDYTDLARGLQDLVTYHRMMPWDHAPGSLILKEAGGVLRSLDKGKDYCPAMLGAPHMAARDRESWERFAEVIRRSAS